MRRAVLQISSSSSALLRASRRYNTSFLANAYLTKGEHRELFPYPAKYNSEDEAETVADLLEKIPSPATDAPAGVAEAGLWGCGIPFEMGGLGLSHCGQVRVIEKVARSNPALAASLRNAQSLGCHAVGSLGSKEQKGTFLPKCSDGSVRFTMALREEGMLYDVSACKAAAVISPSSSASYVVNGVKCNVEDADAATHFLLFAKTEAQTVRPSDGVTVVAQRLTLFIVDKKSAGVTVDAAKKTVTFKDVSVPLDNILGVAGEGFKAFLIIQHCAHITQAAMLLGMTRELLQHVPPHLTGRFYAAESLTYLVAANMDRNVEDHIMEDIAMKTFVTDTARAIVEAAGAKAKPDVVRRVLSSATEEGHNDVLRMFLTSVGCEDFALAMSAASTLEVMQQRTLRSLGNKEKLFPELATNNLPADLSSSVTALEKDFMSFGEAVEKITVKSGPRLLESQVIMCELADVAAELYARAACLSRAIHSHKTKHAPAKLDADLTNAFCAGSAARTGQLLAGLTGTAAKHIEGSDSRIAQDVALFARYVPEPPVTSSPTTNTPHEAPKQA